MKREIKYIGKILGLLLISVIAGTLLLVAVYMLPVQNMKDNARRSTAIYDYEWVYPQIMAGYKMSQLDNCTDATMVLNAICPKVEDVVSDAMTVNRVNYPGRTPVGSLTDYANDVIAENQIISYPRYWHGYLVVLKPLLMLFDIADIRIFNMFCFFTLLIYIVLQMERQGLKKYIPWFAITIALLNPLAIPLSFQFSTVTYIALLSVIFVLKKENWAREKSFFFFMIIGILTAYFDFFTFPLVGLYFPMIFLLIKENEWKKATKMVVINSIAWIVGYVGMWASKWLVGSLLTGKNILVDAILRANDYANPNEADVSRLEIILKNVLVLVKWPIIIVGVIVAVRILWHILGAVREKQSNGYIMIPYLIIAIAPIVWYMAAGTHSYVHYWFTYRELCVSVFAVLVGMWRVGEANKIA